MHNFDNSCCCAKSPPIKTSTRHNSMGAIISVNDLLIPNLQSFTQITYHIDSCFYARQCLSASGCHGVCYLLYCNSQKPENVLPEVWDSEDCFWVTRGSGLWQ